MGTGVGSARAFFSDFRIIVCLSASLPDHQTLLPDQALKPSSEWQTQKTTKGADKDITKQESRMNLVVGIFTAVIPVFALLKRLKVIPKDSPILVVVLSLSVE